MNYKEEALRMSQLRRENRHDSITGKWIGPDPEPKPGTCKCIVCAWMI